MSADKRRGRPKGSGIDDNGQLERIAALLAADPDLKPTTAIRKIGVSDPSVIRRLRDKFHLAREGLMSELEAPVPAAKAQAEPAPAAPTVKSASRANSATAKSAPEAARAVPARFAQPVRRAEVEPKAATPKANARAAAPAKAAPPVKAAVPDVAMPTAAPSPKVALPKIATEQVAQSAPPKAMTPAAAQPQAAPTAATKAATIRPAEPAKASSNHHAAFPQHEVLMNTDVGNWMLTLCGLGISAASAAFEANVRIATQLVKLPQVAIALRQQVVMNQLALAMTAPRPAKSRLN